MNMKRPALLIFLLSWLAVLSHAQTPGTFAPTPEEIDYIKNKLIAREGSNPDTLIYLPVQPHVVTNLSGEGVTNTELSAGIATVNRYFAGVGVQFYLRAPITFSNLNLTDFNRFSEEPILLAESSVGNAINLYCLNTVQDFSANEVWGYTYFPNSPLKNAIFARKSAFANARELTRLFAHYFGLLNTYEIAAGAEAPDSTNCGTTGDLICDTAADVATGITVDTTSCTHNGATVDAAAGGNYEFAPIGNPMSAHPNACLVGFSPQQKTRLLAGVLDRLENDTLDAPADLVLLPAAFQGQNFGRYTTLSWTDIADNELGFWLERSTRPDSGFVMIAGLPANAGTYLDSTVVAGQDYYYRLTPANSGFSYSEVLEVKAKDAHCTPIYTEDCTVSSIKRFEIASIGLNATYASCTPSQFRVTDASHLELRAGLAYNFSIEFAGDPQQMAIWLDWNRDGTFSADELAFENTVAIPLIYGNSFQVPVTVSNGLVRMRVRSRKASEGTASNPCDSFGAGETQDYWLNVTGGITTCATFDRNVLRQFYEQTNGSGWTSANNWNTDLGIQFWEGVGVNAQGCVQSLSLSNRNITGELPPILFLLNGLTFLDLSNNAITGAIPTDIQKLSNLEVLSLDRNQLSGEIPSELGLLRNLTFVELDNNRLSGAVPESLTQLPLTGLDLKNNELTSLPDFSVISNWNVGSTGLEVQNNRLSFDDILPHLSIDDFEYTPQKTLITPDTITVPQGTPAVIDLGIDGNVPDNVYRWRKDFQFLAETDSNRWVTDTTALPGLYKFDVTVSNPRVPSLTLLMDLVNPIYVNVVPTDSTALVALYNSTNGARWNVPWDLEEPVQNWFGLSFTPEGRVRRISLVGNNLRGTLPEEMRYLTELTDLRLANNELSGELPQALTQLTKLRILWLYQNKLSGTLPEDIHQLTALEEILLYQNQFSGEIPASLGQLTQLKSVILNNNQLEGTVPASFQNLTQLEVLDIANNQIVGFPNLSEITTWGGFFGIGGLNIQHNRLSFDDIIPNVNVLNVTYSPQDTVGQATQIILTEGQSYRIELAIDDTLSGNLYQWYRDGEPFVTADSNRLTVNEIGVYTCEITNTAAPQLTLRSYPVTLTIPSPDSIHLARIYEKMNGDNWTRPWDLSASIATWNGVTLNRFGRVTKLDLSNNNLQGEVPFDLQFIDQLEELNLSGNAIMALPNLITRLTQLKRLDISRNAMQGSFPAQLYQIESLRYLNAMFNQFSGAISEEITQLINLEFLGLSVNNLTSLPDLSNMPKLGTGFEGRLLLQANRFTFADILPNINVPGVLYSLQQELGTGGTIVLPEGETYTIELGIDSALSDNVYRWTRNGQTIAGATGQAYEVSQSGLYRCEITNPRVPELTLSSKAVLVQNPTLDSLALVSLYESANGASWSNPWDLSQPMETWQGVTLDAVRSVQALDLSNRQLSGSLPEGLRTLPSLQTLDLSNNQLTGEIPAEIGEIETLTAINLSFNQLSGTPPETLTTLPLLENLWLHDNQFTGLPAFSANNPWSTDFQGGLQVQNNLLTFEDLLPSRSVPNYRYAPQSDVGNAPTLVQYFQQVVEYQLEVDEAVTTNRYRWFNDDDELIEQSAVNRISFTTPDVYYGEITNPNLPNLALRVRSITVVRFDGVGNLQATSESYRRVDLAWDDNATDETGFVIERRTAESGSFLPIRTVSANDTTYSDVGLTDGTTYWYRVQTAAEAGNSFYSDTVEVSTPSIDFTANPTTVLIGESSTLSVQSSITPASVVWQFGEIANISTSTELQPTLTFQNGDGTLDVTLRAISSRGDTATLQKESYITVVCPDVQPVILVDRFILISTASDRYQWLKDGEPLEGDTAQQFVVLEPGEYQVQTTDALGCVGVSNPVQINVTSLEDSSGSLHVSIFPNPTSDVLTVQIPRSAGNEVALTILNTMGQPLHLSVERTQKGTFWEWNYSLQRVPKGMYWVKVQTKTGIYTQRIIRH